MFHLHQEGSLSLSLPLTRVFVACFTYTRKGDCHWVFHLLMSLWHVSLTPGRVTVTESSTYSCLCDMFHLHQEGWLSPSLPLTHVFVTCFTYTRKGDCHRVFHLLVSLWHVSLTPGRVTVTESSTYSCLCDMFHLHQEGWLSPSLPLTRVFVTCFTYTRKGDCHWVFHLLVSLWHVSLTPGRVTVTESSTYSCLCDMFHLHQEGWLSPSLPLTRVFVACFTYTRKGDCHRVFHLLVSLWHVSLTPGRVTVTESSTYSCLCGMFHLHQEGWLSLSLPLTRVFVACFTYTRKGDCHWVFHLLVSLWHVSLTPGRVTVTESSTYSCLCGMFHLHQEGWLSLSLPLTRVFVTCFTYTRKGDCHWVFHLLVSLWHVSLTPGRVTVTESSTYSCLCDMFHLHQEGWLSLSLPLTRVFVTCFTYTRKGDCHWVFHLLVSLWHVSLTPGRVTVTESSTYSCLCGMFHLHQEGWLSPSLPLTRVFVTCFTYTREGDCHRVFHLLMSLWHVSLTPGRVTVTESSTYSCLCDMFHLHQEGWLSLSLPLTHVFVTCFTYTRKGDCHRVFHLLMSLWHVSLTPGRVTVTESSTYSCLCDMFHLHQEGWLSLSLPLTRVFVACFTYTRKGHCHWVFHLLVSLWHVSLTPGRVTVTESSTYSCLCGMFHLHQEGWLSLSRPFTSVFVACFTYTRKGHCHWVFHLLVSLWHVSLTPGRVTVTESSTYSCLCGMFHLHQEGWLSLSRPFTNVFVTCFTYTRKGDCHWVVHLLMSLWHVSLTPGRVTVTESSIY